MNATAKHAQGPYAFVEASSVPLSPAARAAIHRDPKRLATALTGGDDYEILFTASPSAERRIAELSRTSGVPITSIGRMVVPDKVDQPRAVVLDDLGKALSFTREGWTHFGGQL